MRTMMACGHSADARTNEGNPCCFICFGNPNSLIERAMPELIGRHARCEHYGRKGKYASMYCKDWGPKSIDDICLCERPSTDNLPFLEYRGPGSNYATNMCKNCPYSRNAHTPINIKNSYNKMCGWFTPRGAAVYDVFYCGCALGWD